MRGIPVDIQRWCAPDTDPDETLLISAKNYDELVRHQRGANPADIGHTGARINEDYVIFLSESAREPSKRAGALW